MWSEVTANNPITILTSHLQVLFILKGYVYIRKYTYLFSLQELNEKVDISLMSVCVWAGRLLA